MSLIIMGLTTRDLQNQKEETKNYKFLEFGVDRAYIEWDTAIQKPQDSLRNAYTSGQHAQQSIHLLADFQAFKYLYLVQYWPN